MTSLPSMDHTIGVDMSLQDSSMSISTAAKPPKFSKTIEQIQQKSQEQKHQSGSNNELQEFQKYIEDSKYDQEGSFSETLNTFYGKGEKAKDENNDNDKPNLSIKSKPSLDKFDTDMRWDSDDKFVTSNYHGLEQQDTKNNLKNQNDDKVVNDLLKQGNELLRKLEKSKDAINNLSVENAILMDDLMMAEYGMF